MGKKTTDTFASEGLGTISGRRIRCRLTDNPDHQEEGYESWSQDRD